MSNLEPYTKNCVTCKQKITLALDPITGKWRAYDDYQHGDRHRCITSSQGYGNQEPDARANLPSQEQSNTESEITASITVEQQNRFMQEIIRMLGLIAAHLETVAYFLGNVDRALSAESNQKQQKVNVSTSSPSGVETLP